MASLIACAESGFEPIPGYVLRQKLGAGGYGEVWLADAPGGLKKAIKFVFGSLDDTRAASELKALQRIRQVNHPFLLSLERIEILEGQLIIVTELADGSLCDQFTKCRTNGLVGIPRDQLLDYLRDAADALDFLCQKHDLQHLDVKPANMLLVADRVKVADFGLVKDVQSHSMSMLGGMTPTYAAPEMFDGRPGRFSDQYSLAVVYQELLTGTLPFGGRTTAQLASEHLHRAPNLEPVPPIDRPILTKALAKKANQRYASCREFIDQLIKADRIVVSAAPAVAQETPVRNPADFAARHIPRPVVRETDGPKTCQVDIGTSTQSYEKREIETLPNVEIPKAQTEIYSPTFYIGLGGTGAEMLTELRSEMKREGIEPDERLDLGWLLIDTDNKGLEEAIDVQTCGHLSSNCTLHIPLKPSQYYREQDEFAFSPISRRWLYNVPRSRTTEGIRPLGMLAMLDHAETCHKVLLHYMQHLKVALEKSNASSVRVYLLASAHGGTGSSILSEIAFLIRRVADECGVAVTLQVFMTVGESNDASVSDLRGASAIACLSELAHYVQTGGLHPGLPALPPSQSAPKPPIDQVYVVHGGRIGDYHAWDTAVHQAVEYVLADSWSPLGTTWDACRKATIDSAEQERDLDWTPWLRTLCSRRLDLSSHLNPKSVSMTASLEVAQRWMVRLRMNQLDLSSESLPENGNSASQRKKTLEHIDFMISDLFREQRWTAQAWVNRCLEMLFQANRVPLEQESYYVPVSNANLMQEGIELEVERISERLGIDLEQSRLDAIELLDSTVKQLCTWVHDRWLPTKAGWSHLNTMLHMLGRRFSEQGNSLCNVSQRLRGEHDAILEKLHGQQQAIDGTQTEHLIGELDRLEIQARVHDIAGQMLGRLGEHVKHLAATWSQEAMLHYHALESFCRPVAEELDVRLSPNGLLAESMMPLPSEWEPVRSHAGAQVEEFLALCIDRSRKACWGETIEEPSSLSQLFSETNSDWNSHETDSEGIASSTAVTSGPACKVDQQTMIDLLQSVSSSAEQQCEGLGITWARMPEGGKTEKRSSSILNQVRESTPVLLQWGGAKRNFLLLPAAREGEDNDARWKSMFHEPVNIVRSTKLSSPMMICEGERMILPELVCRMWTPDPDKIELSNRLHSRADVDWMPIVL